MNNKIAVIVGGTSGIGYATAELLARQNYKLIIIGANPEKLQVATEKLERLTSIESFQCDVSDADSVLTLFETIKQKNKKVDCLINAVGVSIPQSKGKVDIENFAKLLGTNLNPVYMLSMMFGYQLIGDGGSIVNVASVRGRTGTDSFSSGYAAAKAGVINLTKTFALELAEKQIRVNCVAPGLVYPTDLSRNWSAEFRLEMANKIPLGRLGSPEEIASVIEFLVSSKSSYITGQTIDTNGGLWMN